eukprot:scpid47728/ scgid19417/ 
MRTTGKSKAVYASLSHTGPSLICCLQAGNGTSSLLSTNHQHYHPPVLRCERGRGASSKQIMMRIMITFCLYGVTPLLSRKNLVNFSSLNRSSVEFNEARVSTTHVTRVI